MPINPAAPQNPYPQGNETLMQNAGRNREADDSDRDAGRQPSTNAAEAGSRVHANEASTESRPSGSDRETGRFLDMVV